MVTTQLRSRLPLLPPDAEVLSAKLALHRAEGRLVLFNAAGPIYQCRADDPVGVRLAANIAVGLGLAPMTVMARALGFHRVTLHRDASRVREGGVDALQPRKRGPKGPHALTPKVLRTAQRALDAGASMREAGRRAGVTHFTIGRAVKQNLLTRPAAEPSTSTATPIPTSSPSAQLSTPAERAVENQSSAAGVAVKRTEERALARVGALPEATPQFEAAEGVTGAGVLLALPALLQQGLVEVGERVYDRLSNGFFGLRSVLLTFAFMALLRIRSPEQLTEHAPGELGLLLGLDRVPEVKTLRRKLREMGVRGLARDFARQLAERWAKAEPRELALLYVDGHVRPYHGRTHVLPKQHVQQRGRPMPGTKDFHVNDRRADPLFFVTADANEGLLAMLDATLLPEVRRLVGPGRRVTVAFDREGWSPRLFAKWKKAGFDVLTYRKGKQSRWRDASFEVVRGTVGGEKVEYRLAEREVKLRNGPLVREVRRLTDDGHQTAIVTTNEQIPLLSAAHRMFSRWRQENFFRYMRHEFALDHLCTHEVEPADPKRLVTSPERAEVEKKLKAARAARTKLIERRLGLAPGKTVRIDKRTVGEDELDELIARRDADIERLAARRSGLSKQVPIDTVLGPGRVVQLERERKVLVDAVKLVAYRAESSLARVIEPFFARHQDEARKFLKSVFSATADLVPDHRARRLTVRFHGLASPRATRALAELCALVNEDTPVYPGTELRLHFEAPVLQE